MFAGLVASVVVAVAFMGVRAWQVKQELSAARDSAYRLRDAVKDGDIQSARSAAKSMLTESDSAKRHADGASFRLLSALPIVGGDARAIRTMSDVINRVSSLVVPSVVEAASLYADGELTPKNGVIPLTPISGLQEPLETSAAVISQSETDLQTLDEGRLGAVNMARAQLLRILQESDRTLEPVLRAVKLLPGMLGQGGERRYLLVLQNNAEIRSTGGFAGSTFLVTAKNGQVSLGEPVAGASIAVENTQSLPVSADEKELFGDSVATSFTAASKIPDFPRAAALMATRYQMRTGIHLDGVLATDPVMLSYVLAATGPVQVGDTSLTSANAVEVLLSDAYSTYPDPADQDAFFRDAGSAVFTALTASADSRGLVDAARRGAAEGRLLLMSGVKSEEQLIADSGLSGALNAAQSAAALGFYVNDETPPNGSKLSYYLGYKPAITGSSCTSDRESVQAKVTLTSSAPPHGFGLPPYVLGETGGDGTEVLAIYLVGIKGGAIHDVSIDGADVNVDVVRYKGRPFVRVSLSLAAGASRSLSWRSDLVAGHQEMIGLQLTPAIRSLSAAPPAVSPCRESVS